MKKRRTHWCKIGLTHNQMLAIKWAAEDIADAGGRTTYLKDLDAAKERVLKALRKEGFIV